MTARDPSQGTTASPGTRITGASSGERGTARQGRGRRPSRFIATAIALIATLHAYVGLRLLPDLALPAPYFAGAVAALAVSTLAIPIGLLARFLFADRYRALERMAAWIGLTVTGFASSLFVLTVLRDVALLLLAWPLATGPFERFAHASATATVALAVAFTVVGLWNARRQPAVVRVDVPVDDLPIALHGLTITQISDLHVGPTIRRRFLERVVDRVNALESDLIAITGDLVDGSVEDLAHHTRPLERLKARHGAFFVTGNHEYYSGAAAWVRELRGLGLRVLENEHVVVEHAREIVVVAGVTDYSAHHFDERQRSDPNAALAGAPPRAGVRILLAHQPRSAAAANAAGFDLQLSGHTHGGQFFPWNYFVRFQQPFTAGLHRLGRLWIYTSRGTGYWGPPKRLGAPAEITLLRLVPA